MKKVNQSPPKTKVQKIKKTKAVPKIEHELNEKTVSSIDLKRIIRLQVKDQMADLDFKQEMAQEILQLEKSITPQADSPMIQNNLGESEYVKLSELQEIVDKLITRNVVQSELESHNKKFDEAVNLLKMRVDQHTQEYSHTLLELESKVNQLSDRMESLDELVQNLCKISIRTEVLNILHELSESNRSDSTLQAHHALLAKRKESRKNGAFSNAKPLLAAMSDFNTRFNKDAQLPIQEQGQDTCKFLNKRHQYDELRRKYDVEPDKNKQMTPSDLSLEVSVAKAKGAMISFDSTTQFGRREAERRQFEANRLMHRKSPFTMQLNRRKDLFSKTLGDSEKKTVVSKPNFDFKAQHEKALEMPRKMTFIEQRSALRPYYLTARQQKEDGEEPSDWLYEQ